MRILIVSPYLPWPLNSGGNAAQFSTLKCLQDDHQFTLVCPVYADAARDETNALKVQLPRVRVRAVFCGRPGPALNRLARAVKPIVRWGRRWLNPPPPNAANGAEAPYYPFNPLPPELILAIRDELSNGVDLCQAEFAEMLPLGAWLPADVPKLFIHHQIHFIYARRFVEAHGASAYSSYLTSVMEREERDWLLNFDGVIAFSDQDRQVLLTCVAPEKLFTSPFPIPADVAIAQDIPPAFDGRFLFVASEAHSPNADALEWLLAKIWPEMRRQLPAARLVVVGNWSDAAKARFAAQGVSFAGFVNDLAATLRGGIMLVPLRIGSGIRVKILAALALGVPVVSTAIGCEGMLLKNEEDLLVRDSDAAFAEAAVQLSRNPDLWRRLALSGKDAVVKHYSPEGVRRRRNEIYSTLARAAQSRRP